MPVTSGDRWLLSRALTRDPRVFNQRALLLQPPRSLPGLHRRSANLLHRARPLPAAWRRGKAHHRRAAFHRVPAQHPPKAPRLPPALRRAPVPCRRRAHLQSRAAHRQPAASPRRARRPRQAHPPPRRPARQQRNRSPYPRRRQGNGLYSATSPRDNLLLPGQPYGNRPKLPVKCLPRKLPPKTDSVLRPAGRSLKHLLRRVCRMCRSRPTTTFPSRMRNRRRKNGTPARTSNQGGHTSRHRHHRQLRPKPLRRPQQHPKPGRRRLLLLLLQRQRQRQLRPRLLTRQLHRILINP